jgi:CysZ protein
MIASFFASISNYGKALSFLSKHKLWGFMLLPVALNMAMLFAMGWLAFTYNSRISEYLYAWLVPANAGESLASWIKILGTALVWLVTLFFYAKVYKYLLLMLLTPFLSLLAGKTMEVLHGREEPFVLKRFLSDIVRGIVVTLQSLAMEIGLAGLLFVLSFIPFLTPFTGTALLLVEWFFLGASMFDYYNELEGRTAKQSWQFCWKHKGATLGTGLGMYLFMLIPFGILITPMLSVVAACLTGFGLGKKGQ